MNRDILQNWLRKEAIDFNVMYPEEVKKTLEDLPGYMKDVKQSTNDISKSLKEVAESGDKLSATGDRAIVLGDKVVDRYDKAVEYLPWLGTGLFGGGLLGALAGGKKHTLLGSIIGATGGVTAGGIAKYLYDRHRMNKQASADELDRRKRLYYKLHSR